MTQQEIDQAEQNAIKDAEALSLVLLLLFRQKHGFQGRKIEYDQTTAKFRIDGRAISASSIRAMLRKVEDKLGRRLLKITTDLEQNQITFAQWKREFDRTISSAHILAGALALGSIAAAAKNATIQARIDQQWQFADNFADQIRRNAVTPRVVFSGNGIIAEKPEIQKTVFRGLSPARIRARAKSYIRAAHITFTNIELDLAKSLGFHSEARRVLRAAEHCGNTAFTPGCLELAAKGWMPVDEMVPIGEATCGRHCRCYIEYR